jgi:hypothetical protein
LPKRHEPNSKMGRDIKVESEKFEIDRQLQVQTWEGTRRRRTKILKLLDIGFLMTNILLKRRKKLVGRKKGRILEVRNRLTRERSFKSFFDNKRFFRKGGRK